MPTLFPLVGPYVHSGQD
ncbi:hypothetical protein H9L39_14039 [Fusarium oxysporum f. sp. albedinis]|nr:hypothetical protein H9L39_14039 [Fusarium oxysporum f. sp. albedinis]